MIGAAQMKILDLLSITNTFGKLIMVKTSYYREKQYHNHGKKPAISFAVT